MSGQQDATAIVKKLIDDNAKPYAPQFPDGVVEFADIEFDPQVSNYLVKSLIDESQIGMVYGGPGSGKTFWTLDLALHIATGREWRGLKVRRAFVLYVAAENPDSVAKRAVAWREQHDPEGRVPFALMTARIDLRTEESQRAILAAVEAGKRRHKCTAALVIVDTLARAAPGIDENASADMGDVIGAGDRIRDETGASVCFVHHCGKNADNGARGHSSLKGAVDFEFEVRERVATATKVRDEAIGAAYPFRLDRVELGTDTDGDPVTTCIVVPTDAPPPKPRAQLVPQAGRHALRVLQDLIGAQGETLPASSAIPTGARGVRMAVWRDKFRALSRHVTPPDEAPDKADAAFRQRWRRALTALQDAGAIETSGQEGYVWLADKSVTA